MVFYLTILLWFWLPHHPRIVSNLVTIFIFFTLVEIIVNTKSNPGKLFMATRLIYVGIHSCDHIPEFLLCNIWLYVNTVIWYAYNIWYCHPLVQCIPATFHWSAPEVGDWETQISGARSPSLTSLKLQLTAAQVMVSACNDDGHIFRTSAWFYYFFFYSWTKHLKSISLFK